MAEQRLIDANKIVEVAEHAYHEWNLAMVAADSQREINRVYKMQELCKAVKAVADAAPTVDAVPVVHGEWISVDGTPECDEWDCSVCERRLTFGELLNAEDVYEWNHYCPDCGAKMDGGLK